MNIVEQAFKGLYPNKDFDLVPSIKYSNRFSDYNSNVRRSGNSIEFGLSKKWRGVSREIVIGLLQHLMLRMFNDSKSTINIDIYNNFVRSLHLANTNATAEPLLMESFERVNTKYFNGIMEMPTILWGNNSRAKLADYSFHNDTITISSLFTNAIPAVIDYLMHHELLHKKLKFKGKGTKSYFHTSEFKKLEKQFEEIEKAEKEINSIVKDKGFF